MKKFLILCVTTILLLLYSYAPRNVDLIPFDWKITRGVEWDFPEFIYFKGDSCYTYQWPIIRRGDRFVGIVFVYFAQRLIIYSPKDNAFAFYRFI